MRMRKGGGVGGEIRKKNTTHLLSLNPTTQSAKRKALDVLHGLGMSDSLLRVIERRQKLDAWLAYGGMAAVTGVLLWAWWAFKR